MHYEPPTYIPKERGSFKVLFTTAPFCFSSPLLAKQLKFSAFSSLLRNWEKISL